jgi:NADPH-dependent glutamate synthase beta subunit-like oxidoreductase/NAD(P)H-flavin reductase
MSGLAPFELTPANLYSREGLLRLDAHFLHWLGARDPRMAEQLVSARTAAAATPPTSPGGPTPATPERKAESDLWLALAPQVDEFLSELFTIGAHTAGLRDRQRDLDVVFEARRKFVQRYVLKRAKSEEVAQTDGALALANLELHLGGTFSEIALARAALDWLSRESECTDALAAAVRFTAWVALTPEGRARYGQGALFHSPGKRDPFARFPTGTLRSDGLTWLEAPAEHPLRQRQGFALSDPGADLSGGLSEIHYCIYCHHQGKDSCSTGMRPPGREFQKNALGATQTGCPLGERISEMHEAKQRGYALSALGIACVDNPMIAGTGHRICNDCMVGCVYQNQNRDPVNIPQAETRILKDVLELPWGFEIYSLLTRWNPFNLRRPVPHAPTGRSVLVVGTGPAGYTLAHHLLNDGHAVVAIDGLKIEPLADGLRGRDAGGVPLRLIPNAAELRERLDERVNAGFGGVAEYGITVRWDKNFLKILRLLLERRDQFALYGGIRFGGAVTVESAFAAGFDHIALCTGAGKPTILGIPNGLAPGVRQASDFLMALQLTGAARADTLANLQIRLPVVVIGGGLTAIDTCTEALAYYPVQVERFLTRYEQLCARRGAAHVRARWTVEEQAIGDEFLSHAQSLRAKRAAAAAEGREADITGLLRTWGGARVVYRRTMTASPAYRNHEEIAKALEEGIAFGENLTPVAVEVDQYGHANGLRVRDSTSNTESTVPARSILVAAGTVPNTIVGRELPGFQLDGKYFQAHDEAGRRVSPQRCSKPDSTHVVAHLANDGRAVTFFGDLHPSFAGNVVTAMASAKNGYPVITRLLWKIEPSSDPQSLRDRLHPEVSAVIVRVERLTSNIVEVVVRAPRAAQEFRPGQFFRLQNFEAFAPAIGGTRFVMEGLALTGAWVDPEQGHVGLVTLEMGGSSSLCEFLKPAEPVVLMGPTGEPTHIPNNETVALIGGGLGNAVLFSIGRAMRAAGCRVLYFAGYRSHADVFKRADIEKAADVVVWCADSAPAPAIHRPTDKSFAGNVVEALGAYAAGRLGDTPIRLQDVDRIIAIGSDRMMAAVASARHHSLSGYLKAGHVALASINSPMQCMMKEICAQCLQTHRDPLSREETVVFTCRNQDQPMDRVVFPVLRDRLSQNSLQEKLTSYWVAACREQMA